jgi:hypothetical protein
MLEAVFFPISISSFVLSSINFCVLGHPLSATYLSIASPLMLPNNNDDDDKNDYNNNNNNNDNVGDGEDDHDVLI